MVNVCSDEEAQVDVGVVYDTALVLLERHIFICSVPGISFLEQIQR